MNINNTTLEQWRVFQTVVDLGSFALAANHLHKSQSTISYSIKQLQSHLDIQLFKIKGKRAVLTEQGEIFLLKSRLLTQQANELETLVTNIEQGWEHNINLVIESAFPSDLLFKILKKFEPLSKGTRIQYSESVLSGSREAMNDSTNDLVITGIPPQNLIHEPVLSFDFIPVAHYQHEILKNKNKITLDEIENYLQIVIKDSGEKKPIDIGWLNAKHRWTVTNLVTAKSIILNNLGICWLPEHMIKNELDKGLLVQLPLDINATHRATLYLAYIKQKNMGPATKLLSKIIVEECKKTIYGFK